MRLDADLYRNLKRYHILRFSHWEPEDVESRIKQVMTRLRKGTQEEREQYNQQIVDFFEANGFDEEFFTTQPKHPQSPQEKAEIQKLVLAHQKEQQKKAEVAAFRKKHPELEDQIRRELEREMMKHVGHNQ